MIKVGIVGATGYVGIELVELITRHSHCNLTYVGGQTTSGQALGAVVPRLSSLDLNVEQFDSNNLPDVDVLFLALPHNTAHQLLGEANLGSVRLIDLSADFRFQDIAQYESVYGTQHQSPHLATEFSYGLPEIYRDQIKGKTHCANPGCYPTATILGLKPVVDRLKLNGPIVIDAKSGVSGAGKKLDTQFLYGEVTETLRAYGTGHHRHGPEIEQEVGARVLFCPHLIPMYRGLMASIYVRLEGTLSQAELMALFSDYYLDEPYVQITEDSTPNTGWVNHTNTCWIIPKVLNNNQLVITSMIDNLGKGAASQAIQNLNIMFNLNETEGL